MIIKTTSIDQTIALGSAIGSALRGDELIVLTSDVGGGKTTFMKGVGKGLLITEPIQSPTFTISRVYKGRDSLELHHFDFYRLDEAGVMKMELAEAMTQHNAIVAIEWANIVEEVLSKPSLDITIKNDPHDENIRTITIKVAHELDYISLALSIHQNQGSLA